MNTKPFLNRTLIYNTENKYNNISEYYLHIFSRRINIHNKETIKSIVMNFSNQRNRKKENEDFICLNKTTLQNFQFENEDKDYYIDTLQCIICKSTLKNLTALFLHYKFSHLNYLFFNVKISNNFTNLKEAHVVAFSYSCFDEEENKDRNYYSEIASLGVNVDYGYFAFLSSEKDRQYLLLEYLKENKDFDRLINLEKVYELSNANKQNSFSTLTKPLTNSNKQVFNQYLPNPNSYMKNNLVLFDIFTGEMLDNNMESMGYETNDDDYKLQLENQWIDNNINNISLDDKTFMKLWNRFIDDNK